MARIQKKRKPPRSKKRIRPRSTKMKAISTLPHPWRLCPAGEHWVHTHPLQVPPSKSHPDGYVTTRHGHCARNPSGKDQMYPDEMHEIANERFSTVKGKPCSLELSFGKNGSAYDELIAGWVQYWNEVFQPQDLLDPDLFKALVASESSFKPDALANRKNPNSARGLTQITNDTRKILADERGELKDHYINVTREQLNDPNASICAGVRWLFHKRALASGKLGRAATWEEAVAEYKSVRKSPPKKEKRNKELMDRFHRRLEAYRKCGK